MSRRYELEPLLRAAGGISLKRLQQTVGFNGPTYRNVRDRGLTPDQADRYAVRLGLHPFEVWPELLDHQIVDAQRSCAATGCANTFMPHAGKGGQNRRYCSDPCRARESMRRHRATPHGREANRRYLASYRAYLRERRQSAA